MISNDSMDNHPLVSVVIPLYNRKSSILEAVNSALSQEYPRIEVIVVDDGSTDGSVDALRKSIVDECVRIVSQKNGGACLARNRGIDYAAGTYIALLDSDDVFLPGHIAKSIEILSADDIPTVVYGRIIVDRGNGRTFLKPPRGIGPEENMSEYLLCDQGFVQTSTVVLSKELAQTIRYNETLKFGQDTDFAIRLASSGARFLMLEEPQAIWADRSSPSRVSNALNADARTAWLNSIGTMITRKAYIGDQGWYVAKALFKNGRRLKALLNYIIAVFSGCYRARLAFRIFLQIFLPSAFYRSLADMTLRDSLKR